MDVIAALNERYTVRAFKPEAIDKTMLDKIFEAALRAPSWANTQPWEIYVAGGDVLNRMRGLFVEKLRSCAERDPDLAVPKQWPAALQGRMEMLRAERMALLEKSCPDKAALKEVLEMNYHFFHAPIVAYLCMDRSLTPWSIYDLGLLSQSIMLAAQQYGVGSATAVALVAHPEIIRVELKVPDNLSIIIGIALGYADHAHLQNRYRSPRRSLQEAVTFKGI